MTIDHNLTIAEEEFDSDQLHEIQTGIEQGLDVSRYAKNKFMAIQMRQIRLGLSEGLDVTKYARPEFDWFQMEEIRKGMLAGIDYEIYADPSLDYSKMRQIRKGLKNKIDLSKYSNLDGGILRQLRKAIEANIEIEKYIQEGYQVEQLEEIRLALKKKLNIAPFLTNEYRGSAIREICKGLERGLDPTPYAKTEYGWQQMREIRLGLENRVDTTVYINPLYSWQQMRELRLGLEEGIDVTPLKSLMYTATDMKRIRKRIESEDIHEIVYDSAQEVNQTKTSSSHSCLIFISVDEMEARLEIKGDKEEAIDKQEVLEFLKENNIKKGILENVLDDIITNRKYNQSILIAKGKMPERGQDGRYEFHFETELNKSPTILPDGSADYQNINWYEMVKEGQKIATYHPASAGIPGYTVTGKAIYSKKGKEQSMLAGKGFTVTSDRKTYIAALTGKIELTSDNKIEISRLCVLDDVTTATGKVNFDGSVHVKGNVGSGASIYATEDIIIDGSVESAVIQCEGEIIVKQGANGAGYGLIEAHKVSGKHFESIKVISFGDIYANYCLNCELYAKGQIILNGATGILAGGTAQAIKKIQANQIGNHVGIKTFLKLGIDEAVMHELQTIDKKITDVSRELAILGNAYVKYQRKYPAEIRNTMEAYLKIENAIYTKELQLDGLHKRKVETENTIEDMKGASAVITGNLYDGTLITIDGLTWTAFDIQDVTIKKINDRISAYAN